MSQILLIKPVPCENRSSAVRRNYNIREGRGVSHPHHTKVVSQIIDLPDLPKGWACNAV